MFQILIFVFLTMFCWGTYGPVVRYGTELMHHASLRAFIGVGLAYFVIAVIVPIIWLWNRGEKGHWSIRGTIWSLIAGVTGALGALGIILAIKFRGSPIYVMPLVFGLAPVVNTFLTMIMTGGSKKPSPIFYAGVILVAAGAFGVLYSKPSKAHGPADAKITIKVEEKDDQVTVTKTTVKEGEKNESTWTAPTPQELKPEEAVQAYNQRPLSFSEFFMVVFSIALAGISWGVYGPLLHKGQSLMNGSRLRPFLCVGLAYLGVAVIGPFMAIGAGAEASGEFSFWGLFWSMAGGGVGAIGAIGIIMAFNNGGKPIFVMPLVFGGAPIINTFVSLIQDGSFGQLSLLFYASLLLVLGGAITVLLFAPKSPPKPATTATAGH